MAARRAIKLGLLTLLPCISGWHGANRPPGVIHRSTTVTSRSQAIVSVAEIDVGDRVRVVKHVTHAKLAGGSSRGMVGIVTSAWSICEEDPACCCAELATDAEIEVAFDGDAVDGEDWIGYFARDELELLPPVLHWR